jgi:nucleoporin SEH1
VWAESADGEWRCTASWKAHYGPVWRVSWAHPEFGQLLASASSDHNVLVWEEQEGVDDRGRVVSRWHRRAQLGDARGSVNDVRFAPRHLGLKVVSRRHGGLAAL